MSDSNGQQGERQDLGKNECYAIIGPDGSLCPASLTKTKSIQEMMYELPHLVTRVTLIESSSLRTMREREEKCREALEEAVDDIERLINDFHAEVEGDAHSWTAEYRALLGEAGR